MLPGMPLRIAVETLQQGGIVAYPTEGVYGLGCDPYNEEAVKKLLYLKKRSSEKGFILIASHWTQISALTEPVPEVLLQKALDSWPGAINWVFPASERVPPLIQGKFSGVALRVTAHPMAQALCDAFGKAIVSTSANYPNQEPAKDAKTVQRQIGHKINYILPGSVGGELNPCPIIDLLSNQIFRS